MYYANAYGKGGLRLWIELSLLIWPGDGENYPGLSGCIQSNHTIYKVEEQDQRESMRRTQLRIAGFKDTKGHKLRNAVASRPWLEKLRKEIIPSTSRKNLALSTPWFFFLAQLNLFQASDPQNCKIIPLCCFQPLRFSVAFDRKPVQCPREGFKAEEKGLHQPNLCLFIKNLKVFSELPPAKTSFLLMNQN